MATVQFGAIVTSIRGKINGHAFRKGKGFTAFQRKAQKGSQLFFSKNKSLSTLTKTSSLWNTLTLQERSNWTNFALNNPTKDRFGNSRVLSGRAMFQKCASISLLINRPVPNSYALSSLLADFSAEYVVNEMFQFRLEMGTASTYVALYYQFSTSVYMSPTNSAWRYFSMEESSNPSPIFDLTDLLDQWEIDIASQNWLHVKFQEVNASGWVGSPQFLSYYQGDPLPDINQ